MERVYKDNNILFKILPILFLAFVFVLLLSTKSFGADLIWHSNMLNRDFTIGEEIQKYKYIISEIHKGKGELSTWSLWIFKDTSNIKVTKTEDNLYKFNCSQAVFNPMSYVAEYEKNYDTFVEFITDSLNKTSYTYWQNMKNYTFDPLSKTKLTLNFDLKDIDGNIIIPSNIDKEQNREDDKDIEDSKKSIEDLLGGGDKDVGDISNSISGEEIENKIDNGDKTDIKNIPKTLSNAFKNIIGIFKFVDNVKRSLLEIYKIIIEVIENSDGVPNISSFVSSSDYEEFSNFWGKINLDLSWYEEYKPFGDVCICMFVYLGFIWHTFKNITNIISGVASSYMAEREIEK